MSDAGEQKSGGKPKKGDTGSKADPSVAAAQIRNLDNAVKRLHQQRDSIKKQIASDETELQWVVSEIPRWEKKREQVMQMRQDHEVHVQSIQRTTADCKSKLDNEILAEARALVASTRKSQRILQKKEYVSKHKPLK